MAEVSVPDAKKYGEAIEDQSVQSQNKTSGKSQNRGRWNFKGYDLFEKHLYPGKFIIFNHLKFDEDLELTERGGTDKDASRLEKTLRTLGFQEALERQNDLKFDDINARLNEVLEQDFKDYGSLVVAILTHGGEGRQVYAYDQPYKIEEIKELFSKTKAATKLAKKPKIFLIQACQGVKADDGIETYGDEVGDPGCEIQEDTVISIPIMADFLIAFSSASGYVSFRWWFIQTLCDAIDEFGKTTDFESILTLVKYDIAYNKHSNIPGNQYHNKKQVPEITSTLTKKLFLTKEACFFVQTQLTQNDKNTTN